jgi:cytochrome c-type biogenesis protein
MGVVVLSFAAGGLSVLSPCVLPLLPIVVASALQAHRSGPLALAAGLIVSSTLTGLFFASLGFTLGLERDTARGLAAGLMAATGAVLLVPRLQELAGRVATPLAAGAASLVPGRPSGLHGQVVLGVLLGAIWTPCTGPTLAAAIALATRSESLTGAGLVMLVFSLGAVAPVLVLAYGSRHAALRRGVTVSGLAALGKPTLGVLLLLVGGLALTGVDKVIEAWMVDHMPAWLLDLTTAL